MRIVQTFWTAGQDPLKHTFGWLHPEYNLMSWALSCLSLREHYDEVALYTDSEGKRILIDELHLPYTEVNVVFDDFPCLPQHWALAKIKTYSLQTKPFLHVDGDVYVPHPFSEKVLTAPLVAQNREIGTGYYRKMMDHVLSFPSIVLPKYIIDGLQEKTLASYNMGIFGGSDLQFINYFCIEAVKFIDDNNMNMPSLKHSLIECNILFEQMFFAALADINKKKVVGIHSRAVKDEGYTSEEFCNVFKYKEKSFFHILGGHKQDPTICEGIEKVMLAIYSEYYLKIISEFPYKHIRLMPNANHEKLLTTEMCIAQYEDFLIKNEKRWKNIDFKILFEIEREIASYSTCFEYIKKGKDVIKLKLNPYYAIFRFPVTWSPHALSIIKRRLYVNHYRENFEVVLIPTIRGRGIRDIAIGDLASNIISILSSQEMGYCQLKKEIFDCIDHNVGSSNKTIEKVILKELEYLMYQGIIIQKKDYYEKEKVMSNISQ